MLKLYNTMTAQVEEFKPLNPPQVKIYSCGPTVYYYPHIGNYRTFLFADVLRRYLKYRNFEVEQVMNITDVDDKTIRDSKKANQPLAEFTAKYTEAFFEELKLLNVQPVEHYPKATDHINEMLDMIRQLKANGLTYEKDGSCYFSIQKFENYGKLSKIEKRELKLGTSVDSDEYTKDDPRDFVLWKARKDDEPYWDSEFGPGRPGWHIECSAMSRKYLGSTLDIHTGAIDLIFPHHENEIAQSEASGSKPFVRHWIHSEFLNIDNQKMAKSEGNFYILQDLLKQKFDPMAIRYALISVHYRKQIQFSFDVLNMATASLQRLKDFYRRLSMKPPSEVLDEELSQFVSRTREAFVKYMDDDLNISPALAALFDLIHDFNKALDAGRGNAQNIEEAKTLIDELNQVLGVLRFEEEMLDTEIEALIEERTQARKAKNFARADEIRDLLKEKGIALEDTKDGVLWKRIK